MSSELVPNLTRPETRNAVAAPWASIGIVSPTLMCFLCAVERSITTSPDVGHAPSTRLSELKRAWVGSTEKPRWGAKPKLITLPFLPIRFVLSSATPPIAAATPGSVRTLPRSDSSNGGRSA